jgi:hypothetical protein
MKKLLAEYRNRKFFTGAFSLIELQVTLVILAVSVWGFANLFRVYSLQTNYIEQENLPVSTYYVVSQTSRWMRQLEVPADMEQTAGQLPWEPPVIPPSGGSGGGDPIGIIGSWVTGTTHAKEAGTDRALVFIAHAERGGNITLNSVTYGGQTMTRVVDRIGTTGATRTYVAAFILNDAGISAATDTTFTPVWSAAPAGYAYSSVFLQNVNQATLTGATARNRTSSGDTITTAVLTTSTGDMVIDAATCSNTGTYIVNNGFTEALEPSISNASAVVGYKSTTGIDETPSVTHSSSNGRQSLIGFVVASTVVPPTQSGYRVRLNPNSPITKDFDASRAVANVILSSN